MSKRSNASLISCFCSSVRATGGASFPDLAAPRLLCEVESNQRADNCQCRLRTQEVEEGIVEFIERVKGVRKGKKGSTGLTMMLLLCFPLEKNEKEEVNFLF